MPWYRFDAADGTPIFAHVRMGRGKSPAHCSAHDPWCLDLKPVEECYRMAPLLCDWPVATGKTCDRPLCEHHGMEVGPDRHYCPEHYAEHQRLEPEPLVVAVVDNV